MTSKFMLLTLASAWLVGCQPVQPVGLTDDDPLPLSITVLNTSLNNETESVDVTVSVVNNSRSSLRSIQIELTPFDAAGRPVAAGPARIVLQGPFAAGKTIGPEVRERVWRTTDIRCLQVTQVSLTEMDYAIDINSGSRANDLVAKDVRRVCNIADD